MMLYNITFNVDQDIEQEWLTWIKMTYIDNVMGTGLFQNYRLFKLLSEPENNGTTFALQFYAKNLDNIETYIDKYASSIVKQHNEKFKYKQVAFMTLLESVDL